MKKYSLLIAFSYFWNYSFSSEDVSLCELFEDQAQIEERQSLKVERSLKKINHFIHSLDTCRACLGQLNFDIASTNIELEILDDLKDHINDTIVQIDDIQEKLRSIMPFIEVVETWGVSTALYFESIKFDTLLDQFINKENEIVICTRIYKRQLPSEIYENIMFIVGTLLHVSLSLKDSSVIGVNAKKCKHIGACLLL